jgi:hypothetical protein
LSHLAQIREAPFLAPGGRDAELAKTLCGSAAQICQKSRLAAVPGPSAFDLGQHGFG